MSERRVLVLGAGSIGRRHAGNLIEAGATVLLADADHARATHVAADLGATATPLEGWAAADVDGVVIATPSSLHAAQVREALAGPAPVLVEKPLATATADIVDLAGVPPEKGAVGYNLRFHAPVAQLVGAVRDGEVGAPLLVHVWMGSHLPSWRPGTDHLAGYSAQRSLGGGILLDAIHELDLLLWMLGDGYEVVGATVDRVGAVTVDTEDRVAAVLRHRTGAAITIQLDYLSRAYRRGVEVIGTDGTIRLDWARAVIEREDGAGRRSHAAREPVDTSYRLEMAAFLRWIDGEGTMPVDFAEGARSLRLADAIRAVAM